MHMLCRMCCTAISSLLRDCTCVYLGTYCAFQLISMAAMNRIVELSMQIADLAKIKEMTTADHAALMEAQGLLEDARKEWQAENEGPRIIKKSGVRLG